MSKTIDERFEDWLSANPEVFPAFVEIALQAKREGRERWSADHLLAILRWNHGRLQKDRNWKCNNDFTSRLSRKAMAEVPELEGFFELRALKSKPVGYLF